MCVHVELIYSRSKVQGICWAPTQIKRNEVSLNLLTLLNDDDDDGDDGDDDNDDDNAGGVFGTDGHLAGLGFCLANNRNQPKGLCAISHTHTHKLIYICPETYYISNIHILYLDMCVMC